MSNKLTLSEADLALGALVEEIQGAMNNVQLLAEVQGRLAKGVESLLERLKGAGVPEYQTELGKRYITSAERRLLELRVAIEAVASASSNLGHDVASPGKSIALRR